jgi:hypothetical protein
MTALDLRTGYTVSEADIFMNTIGTFGRRLFILVECIDLTTYMTGYRALFLIVFNVLATLLTNTSFAYIRRFSYIVPLIVASDILETIGHIALAMTYTKKSINDAVWTHICSFSSFFNIIKWFLINIYLFTVFILLIMNIFKWIVEAKEIEVNSKEE